MSSLRTRVVTASGYGWGERMPRMLRERLIMTVLDGKERLEIGENHHQARVRHLWGEVYGVSRPGKDEFRITATEAEDLLAFIESSPDNSDNRR